MWSDQSINATEFINLYCNVKIRGVENEKRKRDECMWRKRGREIV